MAFCTKCGTPASGRFCEKCGAPIGEPAAAPQPAPYPPPAQPVQQQPYQQPAHQQPQYQQPQYQQPYQQPSYPQAAPYAPPAKKKSSALVWVLGGLAAILILGLIGIVGAGFFIAKKAKDAGFDSALAEKNPVLAGAKMMVAMNPELELVKVDDSAGTITIREIKTGKIVTMNAEDVKNGKISFTDESSGQTMSIGGGGKLPSWVPNYPGSKPEGMFSATGDEGEGGTATFKTSDSAAKVLAFYQDSLKSAGYKITVANVGDASGGMVAGENEAAKRTVMATVSVDGGETTVMVNYGAKKE